MRKTLRESYSRLSSGHYYVVGCGGSGCWVGMAMSRALSNWSRIHLVDQDVVDEGNLDRQLFTQEDIGTPKVEVLGRRLRHGKPSVSMHPEWFSPGTEVERNPTIICCADNHPARAAVLNKVDDAGGLAVICANEETSSEAYVYHPGWAGSPLDPRVYYPEILTDHTGDPRAPCTGDNVGSQTVISNLCAATYGMWLVSFWRSGLDEAVEAGVGPIAVHGNFGNIKIKRRGDYT